MLPDTLQLEMVTPERQLWSQPGISEIQLPGLDGYLGILPGHAPLITELGVGVLSYRVGKDNFYATVIRGFAEVLPGRVIVLAERAERAEEIDLERARTAQKRAEQRLSKPDNPDLDWDRATFALQRALVREQVAAKGGAVAGAAERTPAP